jgi:TolB-like protein/predicted Ser/Thr protein kinase
LIGTTLSHYKITAKLGEGEMGQVYLAYDAQLERKVALKVLPQDLADDPERLKRLQREARALAALDHPHIVPVYSFETVDGVRFLTMAFIEGQALDQLIPESGFSADRLLDLAVPLADALRAAHEHGIVHRDLKPANVMVDHDGRLRVLDFGLAKKDSARTGDFSEMTTRGMTEQVTREGTILGTYPYMSPEQAEGRSVDARSDLFSFGVLLYEMACGHRPFEGETGISLITSILRDHQRPVSETKPDLPPRLDEILDRCLEKDTKRRYQTAAALKTDLEELRRDLAAGTAVLSKSQASTVVEVPEASREAGITLTRRHGIWLAAVLAAGVIAAAAMWIPWSSGQAERSLAVLPFANTLQDEESEYLCEGIAESLIRQVSSLPSVRVPPLNAVLNLKGESLDPDEVGRQLNVETVLTGELASSGGQLNITARLQDAATGSELWSRTYDRDAGELLGIQDEIASAILEDGLRMELSSDEELKVARPPTTNGEAFDLYLQARYRQRRATEPDYLQALELLQRATVRDPGFAQAYLMQAGIHEGMVIDGYERPTDGWAKANRHLRQALALDPDLPEAAAIRHGLAFFFDWD